MNFMRKGIATAKNNAFYILRSDSVIHIDSFGKRTRTTNYGVRQLKADNQKIEYITTDSLVLTTKEMAYINDQINKMITHTQTKDLLPDFTFVPKDTVTNAFAQSRLGRWKYFENKSIYNFGVPIFLRQYTYCFFYYGYGCGGECGEGYFYIYKKVKDKWERWLMLSGWMS